MSQLYPFLLWLLIPPSLCEESEQVVLSQVPRWVTLKTGTVAILHCYQNNTDHGWMYWYRQPTTQLGPELIGVLIKGTPDPTFEEHFKDSRFGMARDNDRHCMLQINQLSPGDSALYFCASSRALKQGHSSPPQFGSGTRVTVLEDGLKITAPTVAIFPPSKQEINDKKKATLVCLATDFYPDHIKLVWKVNGEERKEGVNTEESVRDESSKRYSLTSRLRVSSQEWFNSKIVFKCSVDFYTNMTQIYAKEIRGGTDCSVSEESYLRSAIAGKSVYILLIFKSALYGFFVMGLVLRNKQVH